MNTDKHTYAYLLTLGILSSFLSGCTGLTPQKSFIPINNTPTFYDHYDYLESKKGYHYNTKTKMTERESSKVNKDKAAFDHAMAIHLREEKDNLERKRKTITELDSQISSDLAAKRLRSHRNSPAAK